MNLDRFKDTQIEDNLLIKTGKWIFAVILHIIYLYVIYYIAFDSELFDYLYYNFNSAHKREVFTNIYYIVVYGVFYGLASFLFLKKFTKVVKGKK